ncbi:hypothetical protein N657DRAFT_656792 [Parathielavia appendiculata]|uniref:Uncharacterized protein n=1 Tax=Parathielavia appendiculata TaxID=2587402 RepID=A0AAN6TXN1_9PEZI|nr:hypothetical protein N657DRAFT_656792 [Parathielavia appendiculata]
MRAWLAAKAEEDKRRQEEERTRQESYRLEQRRMECEILRTSLQGGIPPPLVPVVFAGMGGGALSPAALDWAQQFMVSQSSPHHPPALMPPGMVSSEHQRRDSQAQAYGQYSITGGGVPSTPGSAQGPPSAYMSGYPGSPTRPRGQTMPGTMAGRSVVGSGSNLPNLNTNVPGGPGTASGAAHQSGLAQSQQQHEAQASPSIYFHHWQPPTTQAGGRGGAEQPASTPSGPQQPAPPPTATHRHRSPPFLHSSGLSNPPPGRRRGHSRQRSDLGSYRPGGGRVRGESLGPGREMSPMHASGASSVRDGGDAPSSTLHQGHAPQFAPPPPQAASGRTGPHSVSSLLSDNPPSPQSTAMNYTSGMAPEPRQHHHHQQQQQPAPQFGESERRHSPRSPEEQLHGGIGVQGSSATRPGDNH